MSLYNLVLQSNYYLSLLFTKCSPAVFYYSIKKNLHNCWIAKDTGLFFPFNFFQFFQVHFFLTYKVQHQILTPCKWNCPNRPILISCSWRSASQFDWYHTQGNRWSHCFIFFVWVCDPLSPMMTTQCLASLSWTDALWGEMTCKVWSLPFAFLSRWKT